MKKLMWRVPFDSKPKIDCGLAWKLFGIRHGDKK